MDPAGGSVNDPVEIIASAHDKAFRDKHRGIDPIIRAAHRDSARLSVAALEAAGYVLLRRELGWAVGLQGGRDLCPDCRPKRKDRA